MGRHFWRNHRLISSARKWWKTVAYSFGAATRYRIFWHVIPDCRRMHCQLLGDYLSWFHASHMALISHTARQTLARVLTSLALGHWSQGSGGIKLDIRNEELANAGNVTPFTASRLFSEWQRNGAVSKTGVVFVLRAPQRLFLHQV